MWSVSTSDSHFNVLKIGTSDLVQFRSLVFYLEQIGDYIKRLAKTYYISNFTKKEEIYIQDLILFFQKEYINCVDSYYKNDKIKSYQIEVKSLNRIVKCKKFLHKYPKYFNAEISFILQNLSRTIRDIARITCQKE